MSDTQQIYCPIRKMWVSALPEELIRQRLITLMTQTLGFPTAGLVIEKGLRQMPHLALSHKEIPDRRADIVCFAKGIHPEHALYPLLLIECKAVPLTSKVMHQVMGYNHYLGAYFIAVANEHEVQVGWHDQASQAYRFVAHLPHYTDLFRIMDKGP